MSDTGGGWAQVLRWALGFPPHSSLKASGSEGSRPLSQVRKCALSVYSSQTRVWCMFLLSILSPRLLIKSTLTKVTAKGTKVLEVLQRKNYTGNDEPLESEPIGHSQ